MSSNLSNIEILDMFDSQSGNSLTINRDVINVLGNSNDHINSITPASIPVDYDGMVDIYVRGDASTSADVVNMPDTGWSFMGDTITLGSDIYDIWTDGTDGNMAVIAIQQGITVITP